VSVIFLAGGIISLIIFLVWIVPWSCSSTYCIGKIKYDTFKGLYHANANAWILYSDHVEYRYHEDGDYMSQEKGFYFGFIDYMKYVRWHEKIEDEIRKARSNDDLRACIEHWQMDIEEYKKRSEKE